MSSIIDVLAVVNNYKNKDSEAWIRLPCLP
jgi:hypothetical protein